jgi:selenocysteine lyase/cysteine desulfurase
MQPLFAKPADDPAGDADGGAFFAKLRAREFARLDRQDRQGLAYLDYTGSALYGASQLAAHHALLAGGVFGNPHSESAASRASTAALEGARERVLRFLDADPRDYDVVFTANTSAAAKLVGEAYPFDRRRSLVLAADNHNSILGLREFARRAGARVTVTALDSALRLSSIDETLAEEPECAGGARGLLAFPAQSNFSGVTHPLEVVARAKGRGFDVLLDAAAFLPSHPLSLRHVPVDYLALSFYKLFGYPTGLGALVARREALAALRRPWFAGGTVTYASVAAGKHQLRPGHEGFEDGTPDFLAVSALSAGFDLLEEVGMERLERRVRELADRLRAGLARMPEVRVYGASTSGTVTLNLLDREGRPVPFERVEDHARSRGVALRGGCFCNPGAAEAALDFDGETVRCLAALHEDFSIPRLRQCLGAERAVGAVRLSVGLANNEEDVDRALECLGTVT